TALSFGADPTGDGTIDIRDVQSNVGLPLGTHPQTVPGAGDANGDGFVDVTDIQSMLSHILSQTNPLRFAGPTLLPQAYWQTPYSLWLPSIGGAGTHAWSYTGSLPSGMSLSSSGWLTGTPTALGGHSLQLLLTAGGSSS